MRPAFAENFLAQKIRYCEICKFVEVLFSHGAKNTQVRCKGFLGLLSEMKVDAQTQIT